MPKYRADVRFFEDAGLEPRFRSRLEDYRNSGYDRGHLVSLVAPPQAAITAHRSDCIICMMFTCLHVFAFVLLLMLHFRHASIRSHCNHDPAANIVIFLICTNRNPMPHAHMLLYDLH